MVFQCFKCVSLLLNDSFIALIFTIFSQIRSILSVTQILNSHAHVDLICDVSADILMAPYQFVGGHVVIVLRVVGDVRLGRVRGFVLLRYSGMFPVGGAFRCCTEHFDGILHTAFNVDL